MNDTPLDRLIAQLDPEGCQLIKLPEKIWVFGGTFGSGNASRSLRESFWKWTLSRSSPELEWTSGLDRPENHNDWWAFSGYKDLLEFERDACHLALAIIVFVESPGAHVELGALAIDDHLLGRTLAVVQETHLEGDKQKSFINLGPLRRIRQHNGLCVIGTRSEKILDEDDQQVITEFLSSSLPVRKKTGVLNTTNPTHILLLLADLVDLLLVSKPNELHVALNHFKIQIDENRLHQYIKLMHFFEFIKLTDRGNEKFIVRNPDSDAPWINYTANKSAGVSRFDRLGFKTDCDKWVKENPRRRSMLEKVK